MSYEGYEQHICKNGHYFEVDAIYGYDAEVFCDYCRGPSAWMNGVDDTNGDNMGIIPIPLLREKFLIKDVVVQICNLGHSHTMSEAVFRVPTKEETNPLRHYYNSGWKEYLLIER